MLACLGKLYEIKATAFDRPRGVFMQAVVLRFVDCAGSSWFISPRLIVTVVLLGEALLFLFVEFLTNFIVQTWP